MHKWLEKNNGWWEDNENKGSTSFSHTEYLAQEKMDTKEQIENNEGDSQVKVTNK